MENEVKEIVKTMLLTELSMEFRKCKHYVFFIDNDVLRIRSEMGDFRYQKVYINPIKELVYTSNYVEKVLQDYTKSFSKWIMMQFK